MASNCPGVDDPQKINAFLAAIGCEPVAERCIADQVAPTTKVSVTKDDETAEAASPRRLYTKEPFQFRSVSAMAPPKAPDSVNLLDIPYRKAALFKVQQEIMDKIAKEEEKRDATVTAIETETTTVDNTTTAAGAIVKGFSPEAREFVPSSSNNVAATSTTDEELADRENATHFETWGKPQARANPPARVRKILLDGLPSSADLTLVQSLIHGGAIDNFTIGANGRATVTFTTADACNAYYDKYPNGITFKHQGKSHVAFIEKGKEVDVISGMLSGHLDCGASRCVRAIGVDHNLGMRALVKLAAGKHQKTKVEHITDTWRNEIRTVIFRFTSIEDAVTFKAKLIRDEDWEACNIQFINDPCEKATGVHFE